MPAASSGISRSLQSVSLEMTGIGVILVNVNRTYGKVKPAGLFDVEMLIPLTQRRHDAELLQEAQVIRIFKLFHNFAAGEMHHNAPL